MAGDDLKLGIRITADSNSAVKGVAQTTTALAALGKETTRTRALAQQMADSVSSQYGQRMVAGMSRAAAGARSAGADIERSGSQAARGIRSISEQLARLEKFATVFISAKVAIGSFSGVARGLFEAGTQAQRLQSTLSFATGGVETARKEMDFLRQTSEKMGLDFVSSSEAFAKLAAAARGTALEGKAARDIFTAVAGAAQVMGLQAGELQGALLAVSQMISKGTVASEELRGQLGERLPGAFQTAARAMGVTTAELSKMLEQGQVLADDFLPRFAAELQRSIGSALPGAAGTAQSELNRLATAWFELKKTISDNGFLAVATSALKQLAGAAQAVAHALQITPPSPEAKRVRLSEVERAIDANSRKVDRDRRDVRELDRLLGERDKLRSEIADIDRRQRLLNATAHLNTSGVGPARGGFDAIARSNFEAISAAAPNAAKRAKEAMKEAERAEKQRLAEVETSRKRIAAIMEDIGESEQAFQRDLAALQAKGAQEEIERQEGLKRKRRERLEDGVRALRESTETELEAEDRRHQESLRLVQEFERRREELQLDSAVDTASLLEQLERDHLQRTNKIIEEQTREQRELMLEPFKNALRGTQQTFTDTFEQIFSGGVRSFADLGSAIKRIFVRLAAEIASLLVFRPVVAQVLGAVGLGSLSGDLLGTGAASGSGFSASSLLSGGSSLKSLFGGGAGFIDKFGAKLGFDSALQTGARFPGATLGATLGAAGLGALGGGLIAGLLGGNQTVGSIGGGLGAGVGFALGGPIGALLGGAGGGLLGGLFGRKKVKTITETHPLPGVGEAVSGALRDIAQILGVTAPAIAVSAVEQVMSKTKKNDFRTAFVLAGGQRFNDAQAAVEGLLAQALQAITGLPAHLQRAVEQAAGLSAAAARDFLGAVKTAFDGLQTELTGLPAVVTAALAPFRTKFKAAIEAGLSPRALALWQQAASDFEAMTAQVLAARDAYAGLLAEQADGIRSLRDEFEKFAQSIGEFRDSLLTSDLSTLSPLGKLDEARRRFELVGAKAQLGDREALGQLTDAAQLLLSLSREAFASGPDFVADFERVNSVLGGAQGTASRQADSQTQQLSGIEAQLKDLGLGSESPLTVEQAKAAFESSVQSLAGAVSARLPGLAQASAPPTIPPAPRFGAPPGGWNWGEVGLGGATFEQYAALVNQVGRGGGGGAAHSWELVHRDGQVILREIDKGTRRGTQERATRLQATLRGIRGFALGGLAMPGLALVGEEGPEIVRFRAPARVHTAQETRAMMAGGGDVERLLKEIHLAQRESDRFQISQLQAQTEALTDELKALRREMRRSA